MTSTRREFFRRAAAGAALAGLSTFAPPRARAARRALPAGRYVDIHTHVGTQSDGRIFTAEALLRWMDANDVAQSIVLPLVSPESFRNTVPTEITLDQTQPYRDRLIPFCSVDPRNSFVGRGAALRKELERYIELGAKGFGEHKVGLPIDDPQNMEVYAACAELKLPVLIHLDAVRNTDQPGLPGLERVLAAFPEHPFIGHGPGWWASIAPVASAADLGGYPRGPVAPGGALDRLFDKYPRLYGDLSAGSGAGAITRDAEFGREFLIRRADQLMFGTDCLAEGQNIPQLDLYGSLDLPADVQARIFRDNARQLLGLS